MQPNNTDDDAANIASSAMDIDSSPGTFPVPSSADTARKRNALETEMEDVKRKIKAIEKKIEDAEESGDTVKVQYLTSRINSENETYRFLLQKERDLFLGQTAPVQQNIENIDRNLNVVSEHLPFDSRIKRMRIAPNSTDSMTLDQTASGSAIQSAMRISVQLECEGQTFTIGNEHCGTLQSLKDRVRQLLNIANHLPIHLYEKLTISGQEVLLRLLTPPHNFMVIVYSPDRLSPRMPRKSVQGKPTTAASTMKTDFPVLYDILEKEVTVETINSWKRVIFTESDKYFGPLTNDKNALVPVLIDREVKTMQVDFTFMQIRTTQMDQLEERIFENGLEKKIVSIVNLLGASGAGKTTTVMGVGMNRRMCYVDCSTSDEVELIRFALNRPGAHVGTALRAWFLSRVMLLVYLQEKYDFDCVDLMSAQISRLFPNVQSKILNHLLDRNFDESERHFARFAMLFSTPLCLDECHIVLYKFLKFHPFEAFNIYSELVVALSLSNRFPMSLTLLTTELKPFVYERMASATAKAGMAEMRTSIFNAFPFHSTPPLLLKYIRSVPEKITTLLAGRARFGSYFLHLIIERISKLDQFSDQSSFLCALLDDFVAFFTKGDYTKGVLLSDASRSIFGRFNEYLNGPFARYEGVRPFFTKVALAHICSKNMIVTKTDLILLQHGILFLDQEIDEACSELNLTRIEPITLMSIMNLIGVKNLADAYFERLIDTLSKYDPKEPSKGIDFQYLVMFSMLKFRDQRLLSLLADWTGKSEESFLNDYPPLKTFQQSTINFDYVIKHGSTDLKLIDLLNESSDDTIVVLPNSARCECFGRILGLSHKSLLASFAIKIFTIANSTVVRQNKESASVINLFKKKDLTRNKRVPAQVVSGAKRYIKLHDGNLAFVVMLSKNYKSDKFYEWVEESNGFWTLNIYFDSQNLGRLVGEDIAKRIIDLYC